MNILNRTEAAIDLTIVEHNFREISRFANGAKMICVIKADAYGHGAIPIGKLYQKLGADILAVACLDEALELRRNGITSPIMILGATPLPFAHFLAENDIIQSVHSLDYAKALSLAAVELGHTLPVHIKLDTGMSRFGIYAHRESTDTATEIVKEICSLPSLRIDGLFTHFAEAEIEDTSFTDEQFNSFCKVSENLKKQNITFNFCHCANSAAVVNYKKAHLNCVRPGLILYGYSPTGKSVPGLDIKPAMTLKSLVADVREIRAGDSVSYNRRFTATRDMKIAIVCCGYADGLPRALSGKGYFLIGGKRAPIIGNVCMDLTIVDVSNIPDVAPFDEAVIFGTQNGITLSPDELASISGTISYELLTSVSKRVPRTYTSPLA